MRHLLWIAAFVAMTAPASSENITKAYQGIWTDDARLCKAKEYDDIWSTAKWIRIKRDTVETSGMDCSIIRFLFSGSPGSSKDLFRNSLIDNVCTIEESPGEKYRFMFKWEKPGKSFRLGEWQEYMGLEESWHSKTLTKCP